MAALDPQYLAILKSVLATRFVSFLPALVSGAKPPATDPKQLSRAFSAFALHKLLDLTPKTAAEAVVDDIDDKGIDAIYYEIGSETLYMVQSKLKADAQFQQSDALAFCEGVRLILTRDFDDFNVNVKKRRVEIETALDECSRIKLIVPYTGDGVSKSASDAFQLLFDGEGADEERLEPSVRYFAADDVRTYLLAEQAYKSVNANIDLHKHQKVEEPRVTHYGVARLADLAALHKLEGKALYQRNIRYYLGSTKSDVNRSIKATLSDRPEDFFYLNNGVTAVCDIVEPKGLNNGHRRLKVRGLSIINGAQTVAAAAEFVLQYPDKSIDSAKVMFTLIKATSEGDFGRKVTKSRNHQNPVQIANFASLDESQERLRREAAHLGYEYHYRPEEQPSAAAILASKAISLDEALRALALSQNDPRFPVWVKSEMPRLADSDSNEYKALFSASLSGTTLVNSVLCYRAVKGVLSENEQKAKGQERLIYRNGANVIASIMMKTLRTQTQSAALLQSATLKALISQPLDQLRQEAYEMTRQRLLAVGPLAFFRNVGNVVSILSDLMEKNFGLSADPALPPLRNVVGPAGEYPRKLLISYLVSKAPQL